MDFQLRKDARRWFRDIYDPKRYLLFDLYYFCLMAGFASGRRNTEINSDDVDGFVGYFPGDFQFRGRLLVGALIHTELCRLVIDLDERDDVYGRVAELVDPNSPSYMSNDGVRLMNQYAHGGFDALCEYFGDDRPKSVETFIRKYFRCLSDLQKKV